VANEQCHGVRRGPAGGHGGHRTLSPIAPRPDPTPPRALVTLRDEIVACRRCPRLVAWREQIALQRRAAFADQQYWGRPVPGFGDPRARIVVLGLAPAAHGGNRTGRVFTGDRSGDWLFAALWRAGLANQPGSTAADDGLELTDAYVLAAVRCAPPANKPTPAERDACEPFLRRELALLSEARVVVALGQFAYQSAAAELQVRPRPRFGHGVEVAAGARTILCSFHPSQQNTFTGRLTEPMLDAVFARANELCAGEGDGGPGGGRPGRP
jgi:uracil-DNA glycosylase family 4